MNALHLQGVSIFESRLDGSISPSAVNVIDADLEQTIGNPVTDERRKILDWLSKHNFWKNQIDYFACAEDGTGEWLLDSAEFKRWFEGLEGKRFLWCCGDRGLHFLVGFANWEQLAWEKQF
jgi:hypothetical protein